MACLQPLSPAARMLKMIDDGNWVSREHVKMGRTPIVLTHRVRATGRSPS